MRKRTIIFIMIILILLIVGCLIFIKPKEQEEICEVDFDKILNGVNEFYLDEFNKTDLSFERPNILFDIVNTENILYATSYMDSNEYFIVFKSISEEEIKILEEEIKEQKELSNQYFMNSKLITKKGYAYLAVSIEKTSILESLIDINISCNEV